MPITRADIDDFPEELKGKTLESFETLEKAIASMLGFEIELYQLGWDEPDSPGEYSGVWMADAKCVAALADEFPGEVAEGTPIGFILAGDGTKLEYAPMPTDHNLPQETQEAIAEYYTETVFNTFDTVEKELLRPAFEKAGAELPDKIHWIFDRENNYVLHWEADGQTYGGVLDPEGYVTYGPLEGGLPQPDLPPELNFRD